MWVSVKNELPSIRKKVLVAYQNGVTIAELRGYKVEKNKTKIVWCGFKGNKHTLSSVTHWMALPEKPTKKEEP